MTESNTKSQDEHINQFITDLMNHQTRIRAYILTMVSNLSDADDIHQQAAQVMWQKYREAQPIKHFGAWAIRISHNIILNYYTKKKELLFSGLSKHAMEDIANRTLQVNDQLEIRKQALQSCVNKLDEQDREFIYFRYNHGQTIKNTAKHFGRSVHSLYRSMTRIHKNLMKCIQGKIISMEDAS